MSDELTAQERSSLVTERLYTQGAISLDEVQKITHLTYSGAWRLLSRIARVIAIWYDRETRTWKLLE